MGFLLPVYGYVAQRGDAERHRSESEDGGWNKRHKNEVETFMQSLRDVYPLCPAPGRFIFPQGSRKRRAFGDVSIEKNNNTRVTLKERLSTLKDGGTLIVTNINHLLDEDPASSELMLKNMGTRIAFLALNEAPIRFATCVEDIQKLIDHLTYSFCDLADKIESTGRSFGFKRQ